MLLRRLDRQRPLVSGDRALPGPADPAPADRVGMSLLGGANVVGGVGATLSHWFLGANG